MMNNIVVRIPSERSVVVSMALIILESGLVGLDNDRTTESIVEVVVEDAIDIAPVGHRRWHLL